MRFRILTYLTQDAGYTLNPRDILIERLLDHLQETNASLERLSDNIVYAPDVQVVRDTNQARQNAVRDHEQLKDYLEPLQASFGRIVSSQMIITPDKMQKAKLKDPWEILQEI